MNTLEMQLNLINTILDEAKAQDIVSLDVGNKTPLMDTIIIATGTSSRHVKSMAEHLIQEAKDNKITTRAQGLEDAQWVLIDFTDVVVHIMMPEVREFYQLEKLWSKPSEDTESSPA